MSAGDSWEQEKSNTANGNKKVRFNMAECF